MSVREWIDKNKQYSTAGAAAMTALAVGLIIYQLLPERPSTKAWYTTDDGQTWFKDSNRKVAPFQKDGKEAVLAHVFTCEGNQFVGYMTRYKPKGKRMLEEFRAAEDRGEPLDDGAIAGIDWQLEYKRPGAKQWTSELHIITDIVTVDCKDGSPAFIVRP